MTHLYRWRRVLGGRDRHGQPCRVVARIMEAESHG